MKQKYLILKNDNTNKLIIREFVELDEPVEPDELFGEEKAELDELIGEDNIKGAINPIKVAEDASNDIEEDS